MQKLNFNLKNLPVISGRNSRNSPTSKAGSKFKEFTKAPFAVHFSQHLFCLRNRLRRLHWIEKHINNEDVSGAWDEDIDVYKDMVLVGLRSLCAGEKEKSNYTIQAFTMRQVAADEGDRKHVCELLDAPVFLDADGKVVSLWEAIKILTDKTICHYENFEKYNLDGELNLEAATWEPEQIDQIKELIFKGGEDSFVEQLIFRVSEVYARMKFVDAVCRK